jgi:uncharacterized protein YndB with AHSA1/START domain
MEKQTITVVIPVNAPRAEVWKRWTTPQDIIQWNQPSTGWRTARAENDVRSGGKFLFVMETKDGSIRFDFQGMYDEVAALEKISYTLTDGRKATNLFSTRGDGTLVTEIFEPEQGMPEEEQRAFCEGVLESFKRYVEGRS